VAVYAMPIGVNEDSNPDTPHATSYGAHRTKLEQFCRQQFPNLLVVRLPGLFGDGLKKNIIFDFMHENNVDRIDSRGIYQFYNLGHIWADIQTALGNKLTLVNFATAPTTVAEVAKAAFGKDFDQETLPAEKLPDFDMHTKYGGLYGQSGPYLASKEQVLADIKTFVEQSKAAA